MIDRYLWLIALIQVGLYLFNQGQLCLASCSEAIDALIPSAIRETGEFRLNCIKKPPKPRCYVYFVRKMSFDEGLKACQGVGAKIIMIKSRDESEEISDWVKYSFYINAKRVHPDSPYFYYAIYPPKYTNIACDTTIKGRDCMIVDQQQLWCTANCTDRHSIVCEF